MIKFSPKSFLKSLRAWLQRHLRSLRRRSKRATGLILTGIFNAKNCRRALSSTHFAGYFIPISLGLLALLWLLFFNLAEPVQASSFQIQNVQSGGVMANMQLRNTLLPLTQAFIGLAGLVAGFFVVWAGIEYMTSGGDALRLQRAKRILSNAFLGLVLILLAAGLVAILRSAYQGGLVDQVDLPIPQISFQDNSLETSDPVGRGVGGFVRQLLSSAFYPILGIISYLSQQTPLVSHNSVVVKLWWAVLGIANVLFVLVVILLGFRLMSGEALGFKSADFRQLLPKLVVFFLLMQSSLWLVDVLLSLANSLGRAFNSSVGLDGLWSHWQFLGFDLAQTSLLALLLMLVFVILGFCLLIYYILRLMIIYVGAVLSPLVILVSLLPGGRSLVVSAVKTYVINVFMLFIHSIILALGFGLLVSMSYVGQYQLLTLAVGIAVLYLLLKTPKVLGRWALSGYRVTAWKSVARDLSTIMQQSLEQMRGQYLIRQQIATQIKEVESR